MMVLILLARCIVVSSSSKAFDKVPAVSPWIEQVS